MAATVIHRARGWHAVWRDRTLKRSLPGDTPALISALHDLNTEGLLVPNMVVVPDWLRRSCPRCGRLTAVNRSADFPTVCTGCRAEWLQENWPPDRFRQTDVDDCFATSKPSRWARLRRWKRAQDQVFILAVEPAVCVGDGCTAVLPAGQEYCQACRAVCLMRVSASGTSAGLAENC
jgi:hypothetical protein